MSDPMYDGICEPRERIHRAARHALPDDPWRAEKEKRAAEVFERLRVASWHGRRANRAPENRPEDTE